MNKKIRPVLSLLLLVTAFLVCFYYLSSHHNLTQQLLHTPLRITFLVLILYVFMFGALLKILAASMKICNRKFEGHENAALNAHSLLINFFMPGQGGPVYRGIFLYKHHKLKVKNYIAVTLLYYAFYATVSVFLLTLSNGRWWLTLPAVVLTAGVGALVIARYARRAKLRGHDLNLSRTNILYLLGATLLQAVIQVAIYAVELHSVNSHITFSQTITYTGAANLALFAALTPGAIGIRESFLIFTQRLHHISSANIVVANVIDRSVYLAFLLGILALTIGLHANGKLSVKKLPALVKQTLKPSYIYKS